MRTLNILLLLFFLALFSGFANAQFYQILDVNMSPRVFVEGTPASDIPDILVRTFITAGAPNGTLVVQVYDSNSDSTILANYNSSITTGYITTNLGTSLLFYGPIALLQPGAYYAKIELRDSTAVVRDKKTIYFSISRSEPPVGVSETNLVLVGVLALVALSIISYKKKNSN